MSRSRPRLVQRPVPSGARLPSALHPVLRRVYAARNILDAQALDYRIRGLLAPDRLGGTAAGAELIRRHMADGHILVVGDFDADGATATALTVSVLRAMGAASVDYLVPNRFEYGYGLTPEIVALARERDPQLIITVDNGISSHAGVAAAREAGIDVLVTDHHLQGESLPDANVVINPNLAREDFPSPHLAGVGVAFYALLALRARLREEGWFSRTGLAEPNLAEWLDLVALGTVADLVPLDRNNRLLVHQGVQRIRADRARPGIRALIELAGKERESITARDLGFALAPRLNAAGRLDDMSHGIETLLATDRDRAREGARVLDEMNDRRRHLQADMEADAEAAIAGLRLDTSGPLPHGLCLHDGRWHEGIVGLVASRIRERVHRPVVAFARAGSGGLKGSARSIPGLHIRDVLAAMDTRQPGLLGRFGGHAMAAGMSLEAERLPAFREAFDREVARAAGPEAFEEVIETDGTLAPEEISLELAEQLRDAGPWGQGFPEPVFEGEFRVLEARIVGERHLKLRVQHPDAAAPIDAICFNAEQTLEAGARVRLVYRLEVNDYRGLRRPQLVVRWFESL